MYQRNKCQREVSKCDFYSFPDSDLQKFVCAYLTGSVSYTQHILEASITWQKKDGTKGWVGQGEKCIEAIKWEMDDLGGLNQDLQAEVRRRRLSLLLSSLWEDD